MKSIFFSAISVLIAALFSLAIGEMAIRFKNADGKNYHIEMWKYSQQLKTRSSNPVLGHEHIPNTDGFFQNVAIRINSYGMRGGDLVPSSGEEKRILFLGSSATLGWGVDEDKIMSSILEDRLATSDQKTTVLNAGIGNYNAERYVELFLTDGYKLSPTDIIVNYYLNDAELLSAGNEGFLIRNSQLMVTLWILKNQLLGKNGEDSLWSHYKNIYREDHEGFKRMKVALEKLSLYAKENNIRLHLVMLPEVHDLSPYKYHFVHEIMQNISNDLGYNYLDAYKLVSNIKDSKSLWAMPGDPHPNATAHKLFAEGIYRNIFSNPN